MPPLIPLEGKRFGRLIVFARDLSRPSRRTYWHCRCDCGRECSVAQGNLSRAHTESCGCLLKDVVTTHGLSNLKIYRTWAHMMERCYVSSHTDYANYGGRGITVCQQWHDPQKFFFDMGDQPQNLSLDRINNDGPYSPDNCRWATPKEQQNNKRFNHQLTFKNETRTIAEWAELLQIPLARIYARVCRGWPIERILTEPRHLAQLKRQITFQGETLSIAQWANRLGFTEYALNARIRRGWSIHDAFTRQKDRRGSRS